MKAHIFVVIIILVGFSFFTSNAILGQTREGQQLVAAELISDAVNTEQPFTVGIHFVIQPDWYLYWKNPGDAGLPIEVKWELPEGWKASEVQFPVPSKFVHTDITAYGYKNEVVLLATIVPSGASQGALKAQLDWLVCRESCKRGGTSVTLDVHRQSSEKREQAATLLRLFRSRIPGTQEESGVLFKEARLSREGKEWFLYLPFAGANANNVTDFYPEIMKGIVIDFKRSVVHTKELRIVFTCQDETIHTLSLRGLLVTGNSAYQIDVPIQLSSQ